MRETKEPRRKFAKYEELISDKPRFMERIRIDWDKSDELKDSYVGRIVCFQFERCILLREKRVWKIHAS